MASDQKIRLSVKSSPVLAMTARNMHSSNGSSDCRHDVAQSLLVAHVRKALRG